MQATGARRVGDTHTVDCYNVRGASSSGVMKLVETLVVRDEADIVSTQIRYHLNAGVDFVIAADHESQDGTTEILESLRP